MAFDAFEQFIEPGTDAPKVVGEDQAPQFQSPATVERQEEASEATEKVSDATAAVKQKQP